jgi:hypothetical protein
MKDSVVIRALRVGLISALLCAAASAQTLQASGTVNATLINLTGIAIVFNSDGSGVPLTGSGTAAATLNMGTISALGPLSSGVTRSSVTQTSFTVSTPFDVQVMGGILSNNFSLTAQLGSVAPQGLSYVLDSLTLTTAAQSVTTNGTYNTNAKHNLNLVVLTASPAAGGPAVGTPISTTINFIATAN